MMEDNNQIPNVSEKVEKPSMISRLFLVFSEPGKVFKLLTGKTDWLVPLIIIGIIGGIIGYQVRPLYADAMYDSVIKRVEGFRDQLPEAQYNQILEDVNRQFEDARANPFKWYYPPLWFAIPFVFMAVISAVGLLSGNFIFGGKAGFWIIMNVVAYAALVGFLGDVVRGIMMILKDSMYVYTGLGLLRPANDGTFLFYLFRQIDIFSIWRILVTAIGLGVIYNMKSKKFAYVLFLAWIIFIVLVAFANTFTGGTIVY